MTATSTSVEAWHELRNSPLLGRQQLEVLRMLRSHGPATAKELFAASHADITLQKRLPELVELGLVERLEPRACRVTGRTAQVWAAVEAYGSATKISAREKPPSPRVPALAEVGRGVFPGATDRQHRADGTGLHSGPGVALTHLTRGPGPEVLFRPGAQDAERGTLYRGGAPVTGPQCACGTKNPCPTGQHCAAPGHAECGCEVRP